MSEKIDGWGQEPQRGAFVRETHHRDEYAYVDRDALKIETHTRPDETADPFTCINSIPLPVLRALLAEHGLHLVRDPEMAVLTAMSDVEERTLRHWLALHGALDAVVDPPPGTPAHLRAPRGSKNTMAPLAQLATSELARRAAQEGRGVVTWSTEITGWQQATFGKASVMTAYSRTVEEWTELRDKLEGMQSTNAACAEEAADVVICLAALVGSLGFDLAEVVEKKMLVNRARKWRVGPDGKGYHVKEET